MADFEKELHEGMEMPVEVFIRDTSGRELNVEEHWHDCIEFQFILEGKAEQTINAKRYITAEGELALILGGDIHATRCRPGQRTREMKEKREGYELMIKGNIFLLMGYLQREKILEPYRRGRRQAGVGDVEGILRFMEENYDQDISLKEVADSLHMNYSYTSRYFKKMTGRNFKEYLDFIRVSEANRMLAESRKSITEISICCGFNGPQAMNRVYGKVTGISPSDMRRLCQGIESGKAM